MFTLRSFLCVGGGGGGAYLQEREQHVQVPAVRLRWSVNTKKKCQPTIGLIGPLPL